MIRFAEISELPFFKTYDPPPLLSGIIRELQVYHAKWKEEEHLPEPFITCLANNEQNLYFYVNDPVKVVPAVQVEITSPPVVVTGPKYKPVGLLFGRDHLMIKVVFHPTGTYRLIGISMQHTVNTGVDAGEIWGNEVNDILNRLRDTRSYDTMIEIVSSFLERKFNNSCRPGEPIDEVVAKMLNPLNSYSLEEWASMACLSLRQFERNFTTRVGISPKLFLRIARFEYAMQVKKEYPNKSWAEIALECSYTDSSHLQREFKEFAEFQPGKFYKQPTSGYSEFPTG